MTKPRKHRAAAHNVPCTHHSAADAVRLWTARQQAMLLIVEGAAVSLVPFGNRYAQFLIQLVRGRLACLGTLKALPPHYGLFHHVVTGVTLRSQSQFDEARISFIGSKPDKRHSRSL